QAAADVIAMTSGALDALRIPVLKGRLITGRDGAGAAPVVLVNETEARQFWPGGIDPIGRTIEMREWGAPYPATVVGIVGDVRQAAPEQPPAPALFYPLAQCRPIPRSQVAVV